MTVSDNAVPVTRAFAGPDGMPVQWTWLSIDKTIGQVKKEGPVPPEAIQAKTSFMGVQVIVMPDRIVVSVQSQAEPSPHQVWAMIDALMSNTPETT